MVTSAIVTCDEVHSLMAKRSAVLNAMPTIRYEVQEPQQHPHPSMSEGNFKEYDADLRRRKGADADTPHRVTYNKLVRS